jgi:Uncharacterized membrane protein, possible Na+ channel or pump
MLGTLVNAGAVILGGTLGTIFKKNMPERIKTIYFQAIGLFMLAFGISMVAKMQDILIVVSSLAIGALLGEWMNIERGVEKMSDWLKRKLKVGDERFSEGLTTSFLLFCVGSMTIVGAIEEATLGKPDLLYTKSLVDGFSAILLASAFGIGVIMSAIPLFIFQGGITLFALWASSFFSDDIIAGLTSVGGVLLIGLAINILEIKKLRIMNMLPALVIVVILLWIF